jgi:transcriptional regulator with XRE-family HTH domain
MNKDDLIKQFSERLRDTLIAQGHGSSRSASGVNIHKLVDMTGCSPQICRKYLRGEVIPEPAKLTELASQLNVSPGWLLFGDSHSNAGNVEHKITISHELLHYIFAHANHLYNDSDSAIKTSDFLLKLTQDVSQIGGNDDQSKKIIDLALASAHHFK